jgi:hypothetical protein
MNAGLLCLLSLTLACGLRAQETRSRWTLVPEIRRQLDAIRSPSIPQPEQPRFTPVPTQAAGVKCAVPLLPMAIPEGVDFQIKTTRPGSGRDAMPRARLLPACPPGDRR